MPSLPPHLCLTLEQAISGLQLSSQDAAVLRSAAEGMGAPDPMLGDRIQWEVRTLIDASASPFERFEPHGDEDIDRAIYVETHAMPSGRMIQIARRYATEAELDAYIEDGIPHRMPAMRLREILVSRGAEAASTDLAAFIDAATVVSID